MRPKELFDGAPPLSHAIGSPAPSPASAHSAADVELPPAGRADASRSARSDARRHPLAVPELVLALGWLEAGLEVVVPGPRRPAARRRAAAATRPSRVVVTARRPLPLLEGREPGLAYVCRHRSCQAARRRVRPRWSRQLRDAVQALRGHGRTLTAPRSPRRPLDGRDQGSPSRTLPAPRPARPRRPARCSTSWSSAPPPRTRPASTWPPERSCGCGSAGPRTTRPTSPPSTSSRRRSPTTPSATTSPSPRR